MYALQRFIIPVDYKRLKLFKVGINEEKIGWMEEICKILKTVCDFCRS